MIITWLLLLQKHLPKTFETVLLYSIAQPPNNGKSKSFVITQESKWKTFIKMTPKRGI